MKKMEKWKNGKNAIMKKWRNGKMENRRNEKLEKNEKMEKWKNGKMEKLKKCNNEKNAQRVTTLRPPLRRRCAMGELLTPIRNCRGYGTFFVVQHVRVWHRDCCSS